MDTSSSKPQREAYFANRVSVVIHTNKVVQILSVALERAVNLLEKQGRLYDLCCSIWEWSPGYTTKNKQPTEFKPYKWREDRVLLSGPTTWPCAEAGSNSLKISDEGVVIHNKRSYDRGQDLVQAKDQEATSGPFEWNWEKLARQVLAEISPPETDDEIGPDDEDYQDEIENAWSYRKFRSNVPHGLTNRRRIWQILIDVSQRRRNGASLDNMAEENE
ncbi:hypothetical protein DER46DRAFT_569960 [Fusarium sp. MPI-SDFR-AT-0072]|nr:hypothetical protein DER46DRAFT_569960 [Fusarium sp. MPI-SDFR-AT-0072]